MHTVSDVYLLLDATVVIEQVTKSVGSPRHSCEVHTTTPKLCMVHSSTTVDNDGIYRVFACDLGLR